MKKNTKYFKIKKLLEGDTFYDYHGDLNHIVHFFEDSGTKVVVYRHWSKSRGWMYEADYFEMLLYRICILYDNLSDKKTSLELRKEFFKLNNVDYNF